MAETGKKRGEDEYTKIWISREQKQPFYEIKNIFHSFFKGYHLVKKNLIKNSGHKL